MQDFLIRSFFRSNLIKSDGIEEINDIKTLHRCMYSDVLIELLASMNDDNDGYSTSEIIDIANEVYRRKIQMQ